MGVVIDRTGEFDKARAEITLFCLPREIERIDGDAMPAQTRSGIERLKAEWFGGCGLDETSQISISMRRQNGLSSSTSAMSTQR